MLVVIPIKIGWKKTYHGDGVELATRWWKEEKEAGNVQKCDCGKRKALSGLAFRLAPAAEPQSRAPNLRQRQRRERRLLDPVGRSTDGR